MSPSEAASVNLSTAELSALTRAVYEATIAQLASDDLKPSGLAACVNSLKCVAIMADRIDDRIKASQPVVFRGPNPGSLSHYRGTVDDFQVP